MEEIRQHFNLIRRKRMVVDQSGFPVEGGHKINADRHNPSKQEGRLRGLAAAEKRYTRQVGCSVLGGSTTKPYSAQKAAAAAAFRRAQDSAFNLVNTEQTVAASADCKKSAQAIQGTGTLRTSRPISGLVRLDEQERPQVETVDCGNGSNSVPIYCDLSKPNELEYYDLCDRILPSSVTPDTIDLTGDEGDEPLTFGTRCPTQTNRHKATASSSVDGWFCQTCIFHNPADALACAGCESSRSPRDMDKHGRNTKPQMRDLADSRGEAQRLAQQNVLQCASHPRVQLSRSTSSDAARAETTHDEERAFALAREEELALSGSLFEQDLTINRSPLRESRTTEQGSCRSGASRPLSVENTRNVADFNPFAASVNGIQGLAKNRLR